MSLAAHHQHRAWCIADHVARNRSDEEPPHPAPAVGADRDEVGSHLVRQRDDLRRSRPHAQVCGHGQRVALGGRSSVAGAQR